MLVMPLRDEAIVQRQTEIQHSQRRYEALLRAIFETTLINLEINHVKQPQTHDLASFLEVNNISRGRLFDPNSLPSTDSLLGHGNAPWIDSQDIRDKPSGDQDVATSNQDKLSREGGHVPVRLGDQAGVPDPAATPLLADRSSSWGRNGLPTLEATVERLQVAERLDDKLVKELDPLDNRADPRTDSGLSTSPNLHSPNILPVEDASSMQSSFFKEMVLEQQSGNVTNEDLPPKEVKKDQLQHFDQVTDASKKRGVSDLVGGDTNTHGFMPPTSEDAERCSGQENGPFRDGQSQTTEIAGPQKSVTKIETFGGAASTPDEQLRLEEAQSMQLSNAIHNTTEKESRSMPPPVNLSSEFIHDSMVDVDPISSVSAVNEEMSVKQDDGPEHAQRRQSELLARPTTGLRENLLPGMSGDSSRDLMLSRRPPMRIDTGVLSNSGSTLGATTRASTTTMPSASESATPSKTTSAVGNVQSPPERMTTRVSSGALRHKSVSEILGETPRATPTSADKGTFPRESGDFQREDQYSLQTPKSASALTTPDPITFRQRLTELKEKERSKLSTVVFASSRNTDVTQAQGSDNEFSIKDRDYMLTLFNFQVASPPRAHHLNALMKSAHKTLTTADHLTDFSERQACRVLNRIYELQARNCWSLRQIERSVEPARPVTHQDVLLSEMKWMRMDFKEERKWKLAAAKFTADACAVWVASNLEERRSLQIKVRSEPAKEQSQSDAAPTPDLVHSMNDDSSEVTEDESIGDLGNAPAAIFSLPPEMFVFGLNKSPIAEKLLLELPLYQPSTEVKNAALLSAKVEPDGAWRKDIVPISKYAQGKIVSVPRSASAKGISVEEGPPRKRSRFDYEQADSRSLSSRVNSDNDFEKPLEPEQEDVALFDPEHKHIRDRIHTGHAFRPPSEYIMPSQSFFEARSSSQWTQAEDDELRRIVKEYSYNWSLISSSLTLPSIFSSGAERRTPWECFERWISLEGLPVEMAKIPYFRAYHARLQAAQKTVESSQLAQQQQQGGSGAQLPSRRRTTQPYSVERRKEQRHLHLIDAMRKLAKKRETALNKQQHVATMAAMRKAQEGPKARKEMHTPQEFSRLKYTQQLKYEEQARQYRAQMLQHQKAAQAAKGNQQTSQQANGLPPVRNLVPGGPSGSSPNMNATNPQNPARGAITDASRAIPPMQRMVNGQTNGILPTSSHSVPHAPMQPNAQVQMQMQQRMAPGMAPDPRILQEASQVRAQQQAFQQQARQQGHAQPNGHAGSPNMQNPGLHSQSNAAILASVQGRSSPSINGGPPPTGSSTSPRMTQPQALSSGMTPAVNHISSQVKARHPQASPEQITRMTTDQLYKMSEARHNAMQAAAGNANLNAVASNSNIGLQAPSPMQQAAMMANGASSIMNPAHYAQIMRSQQASQQRGVNVGTGQGLNGNNINGNSMNGAGRNGSRSVTPLIQRTASAQGGPRPSQSPSARPVGLA